MSPTARFHTILPRLDDDTEQLQTRVLRQVGHTISEYGLIEAGDKVMVCVSGGKDSYGLLDLLVVLQRRAPVKFDLIAVNLDQKQPGFPAHVLPEYLTSTCSLCSRLRRGHLYRVATELGATKIALGHHRDDILETLLMNLLFAGKLKAMPPKLRSKDGRHLVIRPLAAVREADLALYAERRGFPIIPCDLCGSQENLKRKQAKTFLQEWERRAPGCTDSMFAALSNVAPSLLLDGRLFDFRSLALENDVHGEEDGWLDQEDG
jgi:tRNA 2-thiocytidine biosynthesis protein TtcA